MGSLGSLLNNPHESYILGLWGADRYLRTSSIGLSNTNVRLIKIFLEYLLERFPISRIRFRVYGVEDTSLTSGFKVSYCKGSKNVLTAYHIYVNSRPLVREFLFSLRNRNFLAKDCIYAYFAGRFDGDGSLSLDKKICRIVYGNLEDLLIDQYLLTNINTSVYEYGSARTYCMYFKKSTLSNFLEQIRPYSISGKL